eukprot:gene1172-10686_t
MTGQNATTKNEVWILEKLARHKVLFSIEVVITVIKIVIVTVLSAFDIFATNYKINDDPYLIIGLIIFPLYLISSLVIIAIVIFKIVGLKFVKYFYDTDGIQYLNILDLILLVLDFLMNVTSVTFFIITFVRISTINYLFFGVFAVLRLLIFTSYHPKLRTIGKALWKALPTIIIMLTFFFVVVYFFSSMSYVVFDTSDEINDYLEANVTVPAALCQDDVCAKFFRWAADIARGLEKYFPLSSFPFFTLVYCFVVFIIMNIVTGVILDSMAEVEKEEIDDSYNNLIENLDSIYNRIETLESKMLILGNLKKIEKLRESFDDIKLDEENKENEESKKELKGLDKLLNITEKIVHHKAFFGIDVLLTIIKIILSFVISVPGFADPTVKFTSILYLITGVPIYPLYAMISLCILIMFSMRLVALRKRYFYDNGICYLNISDGILIICDLILNLISFVFFIITMSQTTALYYLFFGFFITIRILIFTSYHPKLREVSQGMIKALPTILIMFLFFFVLVYFFALFSYVLFDYSDDAKQNPLTAICNTTVCTERFKTPYDALLTTYQVIDGDSWAGDIVVPLEKTFFGTYIYFIPIICFMVFIMQEVITG